MDIWKLVPNYLDPVFKRFFRMYRYVFELLIDYLREVPEMKTTTGGLEPIPLEKQLMVTLWYLGSLETLNKFADRFGIGEAYVIECRNSHFGNFEISHA